MSSRPQPGWYADPAGTSDLRWWDGDRWTDAVVLAGVQGRSPLPDAGAPTGTGTLFTEPVLVVNRKATLREPIDECAVYDQAGRPLGSVVDVDRSGLRSARGFVSRLDRYRTRRLEVRDVAGVPQLLVTRPAKLVRSLVVVERPGGGEVGRLVQENVFGKIRFGLLGGGRPVGALLAPSRRACDVTVVDDTGAQVARIRKTFEGGTQPVLTTADDYVVQISRPLSDPLRSLVVAVALTVGTALKQDARGLA